MLPYFKLGTLDLPMVPAMQGAPLGEYKNNFDVDLGGVVGAGLLSAFRVTFGDDGRWLWLEVDPSLMGPQGAPQGPGPGPAPLPPPGGAGPPGSAPNGPTPPPTSGPPKPAPKPVPKAEPQAAPAGPAAPAAKSNATKTESKGAAK